MYECVRAELTAHEPSFLFSDHYEDIDVSCLGRSLLIFFFMIMVQDLSTQELAKTFQDTLHLSAQASGSISATRTQPLGYSPSQHYYHPTHANSGLHFLQPSCHDQASRLLIQNDIAPSTLSRAQYELFKRSSLDDQAKLVMLWRLAPPRNHFSDQHESSQMFCTLASEEESAQQRYRKLMAHQGNKHNDSKQGTLAQSLENESVEMQL